jgi:hypothetical protein
MSALASSPHLAPHRDHIFVENSLVLFPSALARLRVVLNVQVARFPDRGLSVELRFPPSLFDDWISSVLLYGFTLFGDLCARRFQTSSRESTEGPSIKLSIAAIHKVPALRSRLVASHAKSGTPRIGQLESNLSGFEAVQELIARRTSSRHQFPRVCIVTARACISFPES